MNIVLSVQVGYIHGKWESNVMVTLDGDSMHVHLHTKPLHINQAASLLKTPFLAIFSIQPQYLNFIGTPLTH